MVKMKHCNWKPVTIEDPSAGGDYQGLIAVEELTDYDLNVVKKASTRNRNKSKSLKTLKGKSTAGSVHQPLKRKSKEWEVSSILQKKIKTEPNSQTENETKVKLEKKSSKVHSMTAETTLEESTANDHLCINEMEAWNGLCVPFPVLRALAEEGFRAPTQIQALTLPPAILGHRDILGAAETGSGKTLAFGIPIIHGILEQKKKESDNSLSDESLNMVTECDTKVGARNNVTSDEDSSLDFCGTEVKDSMSVTSEEEGDNSDESEDSQYVTELEEGVEVGVNGVGCVKVRDNIPLEEFPQFESNPPPTPKKKLYALILTPTRELAIQVKNHLITATKYTDIRVAVVVGGMASQKQERILSKGPEIVVATPGRLWELIQLGNSHLSQVNNVSYLTIDETDRMVEQGHFQELKDLLERINLDEEKRKKRQNFVFSATLTLVHDPPRHMKKKKGRKKPTRITPGQKLQSIMIMLGISDPKVVDVTQATGTAGTLTEARINCTLVEKDFYLYYFLQRHPGRTLVFCNSIDCVRRLTQLFKFLQCQPLPLHANMVQRQRLKNLERFRDDPYGLMLATDVAARGLDIPGVEHVIHYQVPRTSESYVHRSGRTARAQRQGLTVLFIEPAEMKSYVRLRNTLEREEDLPEFPVLNKYMSAVKQRVALARELDLLELKLRRSNVQSGWFQKAIREMDIVLDEDDIPKKMDPEDFADIKHTAAATRKQLNSLLAKPIFPKGFSARYPTKSGKLEISCMGEEVKSAVDVLKSTLNQEKKKKPSKPQKQKDFKPSPSTFATIRKRKKNKATMSTKQGS